MKKDISRHNVVLKHRVSYRSVQFVLTFAMIVKTAKMSIAEQGNQRNHSYCSYKNNKSN